MKEYGEINKNLLGQLLAAYRKKHGFTQQAIADYLDLERSTYTKYERGRKPEIDVVAKLCELYQVTADEFLSVFLVESDDGVSSPMARLNAPKSKAQPDGKIALLTPEEMKLIEIYRKTVRKDDIVDYARSVLSEETEESGK